jgi:hypothetical protein
MALPAQIKSARMSDSTAGNQIDNKHNELEAALADIFGFTADVDVTESPLSCDNSGRITKALLRLYAAAGLGIRFRDTTNAKEMAIRLSNTSILIDENTGTEGTPVWTNRITIALASGNITTVGTVDGVEVAAHAARHISAGADAFTDAQLLEAIVKRIQTSTGPTTLVIGAIADGEYLKRDGAEIVSSAIDTSSGTSLALSTAAPSPPAANTLYKDTILKVQGKTSGGSSPVIDAGVNLSGIARNSTGNYTFTLTRDFADLNFSFIATAISATFCHVTEQSRTVGTVTVQCQNSGATAVDPTGFNVMGAGNQA